MFSQSLSLLGVNRYETVQSGDEIRVPMMPPLGGGKQ
jgi:hypothetical protein